MTKTGSERTRLVVCIRNNGADDLEPRKVYQVIAERNATREGYLRVVDESGEDYLYPADYFVPVKLPAAAERELISSSMPALRTSVTGHGRSARTGTQTTRG